MRFGIQDLTLHVSQGILIWRIIRPAQGMKLLLRVVIVTRSWHMCSSEEYLGSLRQQGNECFIEDSLDELAGSLDLGLATVCGEIT